MSNPLCKASTLKLIQTSWSNLSEGMSAAAKALGTTCTKGCDHCCHIATVISPADATLIADHLLSKPDWQALLPQLAEGARAAFGPDGEPLSRERFFEKHLACPFLRDHSCSIYQVRPMPCRAHFVISDPVLCSIDADSPIRKIDFFEMEGEALQLSANLLGCHPTQMQIGPLPLMVLKALYMTAKHRRQPKFVEAIVAAAADVPSVNQWMVGAVFT